MMLILYYLLLLILIIIINTYRIFNKYVWCGCGGSKTTCRNWYGCKIDDSSPRSADTADTADTAISDCQAASPDIVVCLESGLLRLSN